MFMGAVIAVVAALFITGVVGAAIDARDEKRLKQIDELLERGADIDNIVKCWRGSR